MGTSRQIVSEYGFIESSSSNVVLDAAHCGFDVEQYQGDREQAHRNLCRELGWPDSAKVILFVGRLEGAEVLHNGRRMTHKNPAFALDVARECIATDSSVHVAMAGEGGQKKQEFEATVQEWGLGANISFLGMRSDVPRLMLGSDLLLFPSLAEGLGMVVVEAQAAGLRVLSSDTTPRESVVVPEMVSFLSLMDGPLAWAREVLGILKSPRPDADACNRLAGASMFSIVNSAARLIKLYTAQTSDDDQEVG